MTKTVDEYIAHEARKQAEHDYFELINNIQVELNGFVLGGNLKASIGNKEDIITSRAKQIEIDMKNKLVEMLVENYDN